MSRLDACIQIAIDSGDVDAELGRRAQDEYRAKVQRHLDQGQPQHVAETMAADEAVESIIQRTKSSRHATLSQMAVMARNEARYARAHVDDPDLILKDIEHVQSEARYLERDFLSGIHDALARFRTNVLGQVQQRALLKEVVRELHGEASGNATAKAVADGILTQYERARAWGNALGKDVGKLDDWGIRHTHHARKIQQAGYDAWFARLYDGRQLDWSRIEDLDTGKPFAVAPGARPLRADADRFLRKVYEGIISNGWDDRAPSMVIVGRSMATKGSEARVLHFVNADAWMDYNDAFGAANPFEAIIGHFRSSARDIALMRQFGPNPRMGLEHATQVIERAMATERGLPPPKLRQLADLNGAKAKKAKVMMSVLTGEANVPHSAFWASFLAGARNLLTAAQLGGAPLSTPTDWVSTRLAAKAIGLNPNSATAAMLRQLTGGFSERQAKDMGFIFDTWFDAGASQARFMGDIWAPELTSRITNAVLRANGLSFLTDRSRVAVAAAFGSDLADLADKSFDQLPINLRNFMSSRRVGAREWDALRDPSVIYVDPTGGRHVNAHWFRAHTALPAHEAEDIAMIWGALVQDHMEMAIPSSSLRGRASWLGDAKPGTIIGELGRSSVMYKSYSLSVLFGQMRRIAELDGGLATKAGYAASYAAFMTLAGALAVQLKEIAKGRDPRPMDDQKFWWAALAQGGGVGIFGDFFSASTSRAGGGIYETLGGPVVGAASDIGRAVASNIQRAGAGKDILLGRDLANLGRRYNPAATFWPTRLALDRIVWDKLQLLLDPEAPDLMRQAERRLAKDYGTQSWWRRGAMAPDRGPDLGNIVGAQPP